MKRVDLLLSKGGTLLYLNRDKLALEAFKSAQTLLSKPHLAKQVNLDFKRASLRDGIALVAGGNTES